MKEFWKEYKLSQVFLSLILAIIIWAVAISELDPLRPNDYGPVPVNFIGTEHFADQDLVVISGQNSTMRVRVEGLYSQLNEIEMNGLSGLLDLTQGLLDYNAAYNNNNYFKGFDYHSWEVGMIKALDMMGTSQLDPERIVYLNIDSFFFLTF